MKSEQKAKTLIEKMGFNDKDISTSLHDEICLFLAKEDNVNQVLKDLNLEYLMEFPRITQIEKAIFNEKGYNIGFIDIFIIFKTGKTEYDPSIICLIIEVKSKMPAFGEILREINFYRSNMWGKNYYLIIAPECNFIEELKGQEVLFWKYTLKKIETKNWFETEKIIKDKNEEQ